MTPPARPEVEVLLATYSGERFLREQIDSILAQDYAQDYPALRILAGTTAPATAPPTILAEYASQFPGRIRVMPDAHRPGAPRPIFSNRGKLPAPASSADSGEWSPFHSSLATLISPTKEFSPNDRDS
jgi:hypothetical protein